MKPIGLVEEESTYLGIHGINILTSDAGLSFEREQSIKRIDHIIGD